MKYVSGGPFDSKQLSIDETITEISDTVEIARITANNLRGNGTAEKELDLIITNLDAAQDYLSLVRRKVDIALKIVPNDVQKKEYL